MLARFRSPRSPACREGKRDITELRPAKPQSRRGRRDIGREPRRSGVIPEQQRSVPTSFVASTRASTATSPCGTSPFWPRSGATKPRPGAFGGWSSTRVQATPRPCREGKHSAESRRLSRGSANPTRSTSVRSISKDTAIPAPNRKRPCFPGRPALTNRPETANVDPGCRPISGSRPGIPGLRAGKERFFPIMFFIAPRRPLTWRTD